MDIASCACLQKEEIKHTKNISCFDGEKAGSSIVYNSLVLKCHDAVCENWTDFINTLA